MWVACLVAFFVFCPAWMMVQGRLATEPISSGTHWHPRKMDHFWKSPTSMRSSLNSLGDFSLSDRVFHSKQHLHSALPRSFPLTAAAEGARIVAPVVLQSGTSPTTTISLSNIFYSLIVLASFVLSATMGVTSFLSAVGKTLIQFSTYLIGFLTYLASIVLFIINWLRRRFGLQPVVVAPPSQGNQRNGSGSNGSGHGGNDDSDDDDNDDDNDHPHRSSPHRDHGAEQDAPHHEPGGPTNSHVPVREARHEEAAQQAPLRAEPQDQAGEHDEADEAEEQVENDKHCKKDQEEVHLVHDDQIPSHGVDLDHKNDSSSKPAQPTLNATPSFATSPMRLVSLDGEADFEVEDFKVNPAHTHQDVHGWNETSASYLHDMALPARALAVVLMFYQSMYISQPRGRFKSGLDAQQPPTQRNSARAPK